MVLLNNPNDLVTWWRCKHKELNPAPKNAVLPSLVNMNDPYVEAVMAVVPLHTDRANYCWCNSYTKLQLVRRLSFPKAALAVWLRWRYWCSLRAAPSAAQRESTTLLYGDNTDWPRLRLLRLSDVMKDETALYCTRCWQSTAGWYNVRGRRRIN